MSERFSAKGAALMRACGYKGRGGLGARERGREAPVEARVKRDRAGLGSARERDYEIVGATTTRARSTTTTTTTTRARKRAKSTRDDDDDDDDDGTVKTKAKAIRANAEAKARRDANLARAVYRAFKSEDGEERANENPVARATLSGMSARNPLRGKSFERSSGGTRGYGGTVSYSGYSGLGARLGGVARGKE
jgi:hypothetical protein